LRSLDKRDPTSHSENAEVYKVC